MSEESYPSDIDIRVKNVIEVQEIRKTLCEMNYEDIFQIIDNMNEYILKTLRLDIIQAVIRNFDISNRFKEEQYKTIKHFYKSIDDSFAYSLLFVQCEKTNSLPIPTLNKPDYNISNILHLEQGASDFYAGYQTGLFQYLYNPYIFANTITITDQQRNYILKRFAASHFKIKDREYKKAICAQLNIDEKNINVALYNTANDKTRNDVILYTNIDSRNPKSDSENQKYLEKYVYERYTSRLLFLAPQIEYFPLFLLYPRKAKNVFMQNGYFRRFFYPITISELQYLHKMMNIHDFKLLHSTRKGLYPKVMNKIENFPISSITQVISEEVDIVTCFILNYLLNKYIDKFPDTPNELFKLCRNDLQTDENLTNPLGYCEKFKEYIREKQNKDNNGLSRSYVLSLDRFLNMVSAQLLPMLGLEDDVLLATSIFLNDWSNGNWDKNVFKELDDLLGIRENLFDTIKLFEDNK